MPSVKIYDTTLRDGAQMEGISFSVEDKLKIVLKLDELGMHYIEGGWPGSNEKDAEFFLRAMSLRLIQGQLVAFGSTRRPGTHADSDPNLRALVSAGTRVATIVAKASRPQVLQVLNTSLEENLAMITDSVKFLKSKKLVVFLDAEHFFDGFEADAEYSVACLRTAVEAGADALVLCDTNGGSLPDQIAAGVRAALMICPSIGIHTHNDAELAVANSLAAVAAGATQVQGTINGYGERCGNANLCSVIPDLQLKMGLACLTKEQLARLAEVSRFVSELANLAPNSHLPYVGASAFTHKGGLHVSAIAKWEDSYQHVNPEAVGNRKRVVVSELSGRANIQAKARGFDLYLDDSEATRVLDRIKQMESQGFQFDGADASFELLVRRLVQKGYRPAFEVRYFGVWMEKGWKNCFVGEAPDGDRGETNIKKADIRVAVRDQIGQAAAEGNGPVNAIDEALRLALSRFFPEITVKLTDYKVRILNGGEGTSARVRVMIDSADGEDRWTTVGCATDVVGASLQALVDSFEWWLIRHPEGGKRTW